MSGEMQDAGDFRKSVTAIRELIAAGQLTDALSSCEAALAEYPGNFEVLVVCAQANRAANEMPKAWAFMRAASAQSPRAPAFWLMYASDCTRCGYLEDAKAALARLRAPQNAAPEVVLQRARIAYAEARYEIATNILVELVRKKPGFSAAHMELAHALLMRGKWRAGWEAYEMRYMQHGTRDLLPQLPSPVWDGKKLDGTLVVIADQGYGDCFQFGRFIPAAAERCQDLALVRSQPLAKLMDTMPGVVMSCSRWEDLPPHQANVTLSGLPRLLKVRPDSVPSGTNLMKPSSDAVRRWHTYMSESAASAALRIGIAWSGRAEFRGNFLRAMPAELFRPVTKLDGVHVESLQVGALSAQARELGLTDHGEALSDFNETAALMKTMDLIITTDTAVAHLAGSLGCSVWVLLAYAPDWRWGPAGSQSIWYPSARLWRQDETRQWEPVMQSVTGSVAALAQDRRSKSRAHATA